MRAGDWLVLAGQVGLDPATGKMVDGGVEAQARQVLANVRRRARRLRRVAHRRRQGHRVRDRHRRVRHGQRRVRRSVRRPQARPLDGRGRRAPGRRAGRDRSLGLRRQVTPNTTVANSPI